MTFLATPSWPSRLEHWARRSPQGYARAVWALAWLGNTVMWAATALMLVGAGLGAAWLLAIPLAAGSKLGLVALSAWGAWQLLHVSVGDGQGVDLSADRAPAFHALLESLRERMGAPKVDRVLITDHFNACIVQRPASRQPGKLLASAPVTELMVGLPLMRALTMAQLEAVLAHEFAHAAQGHGHQAYGVHCQRQRIQRLSLALDSLSPWTSWMACLHRLALRGYAVVFNSLSQPLTRAHELEADARAAQATSPQTMAESLSIVAVVGCYLSERFWPGAVRMVDSLGALHAAHGKQGLSTSAPSATLGFAPHAAMAIMLREELNPGLAQAYLERALTAPTHSVDTHPSLRDRLSALNEPPRLTMPKDVRGSGRLLGLALESLTRDFDERWHADMAITRGHRRRRWVAENLRAQAQPLQTMKAPPLPSTTTDAMQDDGTLATLATLAQLRAMHEAEPNDPLAAYGLGAALLALDDEEGLELLHHAMRNDELAIVHALEVMRDFHARQGHMQAAQECSQALAQRLALEAAASNERAHLAPHDALLPHGLGDEPAGALRHSLALMPEVKRAWLARKQVSHLAHHSLFVMVFELRKSRDGSDHDRHEAVLHDLRSALDMPGDVLLVNLRRTHHDLRHALEQQLRDIGPLCRVR
jgi:hypothetical protein